ncbi:gamma-glutamyl-gamma-aminobutyrate hydrolase family protein [Nisaea acidiphila]|uniref:gamma-glutamyl-gamma-aminobutyrate hydrolase n=1 Tax=Nisaea acidiphila TaxID=1862145 RepID=A0A9J7AN49_9PROT|nr:gamma-glutamyl-gamma-aminobutyrate hydrolase family protein [Nisaea acidiphila]UUX48001.1 gamma-glutamyl-gamma-aminobutyrate hydrolase family protein [Nisaea acidiphila]
MLSVPSLPLIGVTACHQEGEDHSTQRVSEKYVTCVPEPTGGLPLIIPALEEGQLDLDSLVAHLDGLLLTGSPSNVEPHHFNGPESVEGTQHDPRRDGVTLPLIRKAIEAGVPVLGICRGIQEMNVALGGTLHQRIFDFDDTFDHRMRRDVEFDRKYRPAHEIRMTSGGLLARIAGSETALVNSLHAQGIDKPGENVVVEAVAPDGIVEAISMPSAKAFVLGVQWHPEWPRPIEGINRKIFEAFGEACRAHLRARLGLADAAE